MRLLERMHPAWGRWALTIFAVALCLRLITLAAVHPDPRDGRYDDSVWYDASARHLAAGDGYVFDPSVWVTADGSRIYPDENDLTPTALWPPGYPATLAVAYVLSGDSLWAGRLFNALAGALTAVLVFTIACRLLGRRTGVIAGLLMAAYPGHILFTPLLMSETWFLFLMTATLATFVLLVLDRKHVSPFAVLGTGVLTALTAMVRGEFIAFGGVILLLLAWHVGWRGALLPCATFLVGMAAVFTPWVLRNQIQMGDAIVGTTGAGRVALQGHHPLSEGKPSLEIVGRLEAAFASLPRKERELETNREGNRMASEWALDHPLDELRLIPRRMYELFKSDEAAVAWTQSNKPWYSPTNADRLIRVSSAYFYGTIGLALLALPLWWRRRDPRILVIFAIVPYYMLMFGVIFIGDPRYHFALYVPLAVFSAAGVGALLDVAAEGWREVFGTASIGAWLRRHGSPTPSGPERA